MTDQKILSRIRKVLAKAEGTDNPHEAEMLMIKVQSMLDEHNLQLLDVERASDEDPIGTDFNAAHVFVKDSWFKHTAAALAYLYGAQVVWTKVTKNKTLIHISGRESARITWQLMLPFIRKQIRAQAKKLRDNLIQRWVDVGYSERDAIIIGKINSQAAFERQVGNALTRRIQMLHWEAKHRDEDRVASGGRALVPVDLINAEVDRAFGEVEGASFKGATTREAANAAAEISLHRQAGGEKAKQIGAN